MVYAPDFSGRMEGWCRRLLHEGLKNLRLKFNS